MYCGGAPYIRASHALRAWRAAHGASDAEDLACRPAGPFASEIVRRSRQMLPKRLKIRSP